jgi:Tol biopolymer transport system component
VGAVLVGSSRSRLPSPFGRAANGQVAYASNGDIYTVDPVSGLATAAVSGADTDSAPVWSRDGTHFAFQREALVGLTRLNVARSDGSGIVVVTPIPESGFADVAFSPDGRDIAFTTGPEENAKLWIAKSDGSGVRELDVGMGVAGATYRPPEGAEIVFAGAAGLEAGNGLYAVNVKSGLVRQILAPSPGAGRGVINVSPDGSQIAWSEWRDDPDRNTYLVHVVAADGTGERTLPLPRGAIFQDIPEWSNDGLFLAVARGYAARDQDMVIAIVPADGSGTGVETAHHVTSCCSNAYEWAPNDSAILMTEFGFNNQQPVRQMLIDPATGAIKPAAWDTTSNPTWQRRAP